VHPSLSLSAPSAALALSGGGEGLVALWALPQPSAAAKAAAAAVLHGGTVPGARGSAALRAAAASAASAALAVATAPVSCKLLKGHSRRITGLAADLCKVVSASLDGSLRVWDLQEPHRGALLHVLRFPLPPLQQVQLLQGGGAGGGGGGGGAEALSEEASCQVSSLSLSGLSIMAGMVDGRCFLWEWELERGEGGAAAHAAGAQASLPQVALYEGSHRGSSASGAAPMRALRHALRSAAEDDLSTEVISSPLELQMAWDAL